MMPPWIDDFFDNLGTPTGSGHMAALADYFSQGPPEHSVDAAREWSEVVERAVIAMNRSSGDTKISLIWALGKAVDPLARPSLEYTLRDALGSSTEVDDPYRSEVVYQALVALTNFDEVDPGIAALVRSHGDEKARDLLDGYEEPGSGQFDP